jgi:PAS domain S-box-containing protein
MVSAVDDSVENAGMTGKGRFRRFFDSPFFGAAIYTLPDRKWTVVNDTFCNLMGYTREELRDLTWVHLTHPDDLEENVRLFEVAVSEGGTDSYSMDKRFIRKDGAILYATIFVLCVRKPDGTPDYSILMVQDVTARKDAENEVRRLNRELESRVEERTRQLKESEVRTQAIVDNVVDGIITVDEIGVVQSINPAVETIFGYTADEIVGKNLAMLAAEPYRSSHQDYMTRYRETGETKVVGRLREFEGQRKNGEVFPIELAISRVDTGFHQFFVGIVRDISQRKRAEAEINRARQAAEEASEAKSSFLANMSHEIRTPLNAVVGLTRLALDTDLTVRQREYLDNVLGASNSLLGLIDDILDFSKIEAGKLEMEHIPFRLDEVVENTMTMMRSRLGDKAITLHSDLSPDVPTTLLGDPLRFGQVLINLVTNAIKFTEKGEIAVTVKPTKQDAGEVLLRVEVRDTGIGMSRETCAKLFQPFTQADASTTRKFGGTGLGLAISQSLVHLMRGSIGVDSEEGKGSTFWFSARFKVSDAPLEKSEAAAEVPPGLSILVVDDNELNRTIAKEVLTAKQAEVDLAVNGREAVDRVSAGRYDVVFMDLQMPEMDGYEATRIIRSDPRFADLPIIAMTAHAMASEREKCLAGGMNDHISKPVNPDLLFRVLAHWARQGTPGNGGSDRPETPEVAGIDVAAVNIEAALAMLRGNEDLLRRLLGDFRDKYMGNADTIRQLLKGGDVEAAKRASHSLKGVSGNIRVTRVFEAATALDDCLRQAPQDPSVPGLVDALGEALREAGVAIGRYLDGAS